MASFLNNVGLNLNPFATRVGQKIEEATDSNQASENWALILEVCDLINATEDGPKDAARAIRKRLQQNATKNYKTVLYTLTLLEACVKNCNRKFHALICSKDFVQELVKLIGPKNDPPMIVQEKVLGLIQSWADAFYNQPDMSPVVQIYRDLKSKGIEFPMTDLDTMAPIHTPQKSVQSTQSTTKRTSAHASSPIRVHPPQPVFSNLEGALRLGPEQLTKLRSELDIVQENMTILNEMLTELTPGKEHPSDLELLVQLYKTCRAMQERLVELISQLAQDEVTAELLRINDLLNNLFLRYSRYEKNRSATLTSQSGEPEFSKEIASLIDLGDERDRGRKSDVVDLISDIKEMSVKTDSSLSNVSQKTSGNDFDMFAQSRNVTYESSKKECSSYEDNLKPNQVPGSLASATQNRSQPHSLMHRESDFDEMAAWLEEQSDGVPAEADSLTSSEFDKFLAERAAAAENLPNQSTAAASASATPSPSRGTTTTSHRTINKQPSKDMYAL